MSNYTIDAIVMLSGAALGTVLILGVFLLLAFIQPKYEDRDE